MLLRLSPVLPFSLLNYALGLTRVRLRNYVIASVAMLPGTIAYVYSGWLAADVTAAAAGARTGHTVADYALLIAGLLATIVVAVIITRIARNALVREASDDPAADGHPS